jgi:serine phosphatase RsbU (regulator of sigma subunit)
LEKAFSLDQKNNLSKYIGISINNRGNIEFENGNVQEAINSYKQAIEIKSKNNDKKSQAISLHNLGNALYSVGELQKAEEYIRQSLLMSKEAKDAKTMNANYRALANLLADGNQCTDPLDNYKSYISMRFSVVESEIIKPLYEEKQKYLDSEFRSDESLTDDIKKLGIGNDDLISINMLQEDLRAAQKAAEQEIKEAESEIILLSNLLSKSNALLESQNDVMEAKSKTLRWIVAGGTVSGLLILALLLLALRAKNRTKKDKLKIEEQKELIEEKNKGFMDSVTYASRLQTAILPPDNLLAEQLKDFFVLYKPKDIVAGDFYWTETVGEYTYVAAADCTGHGVPGAMVSVVCSNSLFRAVNEFGLRDTGLILDKVRELVIQTFEKSVEEVKDGMDISLVRLEKNSNKIQYTGANNSLIIVRDRNDEQSFEDGSVYNEYKYLEEFKADKQPIGQWMYAKNFTTNTINVIEGDQLFLFSDGYADQFGGVKGKKMKVRTLKELFLEVSTLSLPDQKQKLDDSFNDWKQDFEQIDDVCVMGVRI